MRTENWNARTDGTLCSMASWNTLLWRFNGRDSMAQSHKIEVFYPSRPNIRDNRVWLYNSEIPNGSGKYHDGFLVPKLPSHPQGMTPLGNTLTSLQSSAIFSTDERNYDPIGETSKIVPDGSIKQGHRKYWSQLLCDRDPRVRIEFWRVRFKKHWYKFKIMSTAYHPQTDGQSERTFKLLEDMLRACVDRLLGWLGKHLPLG
ncbi:putative reverse transcriptase domain-containing protein [Tanacetum coccineum]